MSAVITTQHLSKNFGDHRAVDDLSLRVPEGVVYGFLGPNGSGKSTTMKMLLGITRPTSGSIELFGKSLAETNRSDLLTRVGSMIESPPGYGHLTGRENMGVMQAMLGLSDAQVDAALDTVRLTQQKDKLVRNYSLGMKQRLGIALALAREPRLLILDEPTNGLDPAGIEEIRTLLVELAGRGITIMVSSHLLDEIEKMATHLGILAGGRLLFEGTRQELFQHSIPEFVVTTADPEAVLALDLPGARRQGNQVGLPDLSEDGAAHVIHRISQAGIDIYAAQRAEQDLESVFMDLTGRGGLL